MWITRWRLTSPRSLRTRLLLATIGSGALTLILTALVLTALFRDHVVSQFEAALTRQMDQLIAELEFDDDALPRVDNADTLDPRMQKPYSGLYWQVDELPVQGTARIGVLRSRSLWDASLAPPAVGSPAQAGELQVSEAHGPAGESLLLLRRIVSSPDAPGRQFRFSVAGDLRFNLEATERFGLRLSLALGVLLLLMTLSAWAQVYVGLRPLHSLQQALVRLRRGETKVMGGRFPLEVQPLVDDFNQILSAHAAAVERARTQAGNLAHALKTPLAAMENEARMAETGQSGMSPAQTHALLARMRRHIEWNLARARVAATRGLPGQHTDVAATLAGLLRVLHQAFASRKIKVDVALPASTLLFAGEEQDLQEILGNLLENAFKWARSMVRVSLVDDAPAHSLCLLIEDDGPGIAPAHLQGVTQRGVRLDEETPGSGLGLAIVQELAAVYGGKLHLANRPDASGLRVTLSLPRHTTN